MADILCCPKCKNLLEISNNFAKCDICKKEWGYTDGSLSFLEHSGHWEILSEENMRKLIEVAEKENCEIALEKILLLNTAEHIYKYYTDPLHCGYLKLLPEIKNATVLDFGSSLGNITLELAKKYSTVISVDTAKYSLKFLNVWAKQKNIKNIQTILIDPVEYSGLPFQDNSFDIVNFNLVLQWVGVQNEKVNPKESQIKCLKELHRILKPSGIIYLGEINRYHYKFFFGEPDVSMVPYASILPRLFSDIHVRNYKKSIKYKVNSFFVFNFADKSANISGSKYRNYKYGTKGIKKLLFKGGFNKIKMFVPLPDPRFVEYILDVNDKGINIYMNELISQSLKKENNKAKRLILKLLFFFICKLGLTRYFVHGYSVIAQK